MAQHTKPPADPDPAHEAHHPKADDDLIVVPRGQSRFQFFVILGLFIFILIIFTVGPFFQAVVGGLFSGGGPDSSFFRWTHPVSGVTSEVSAQTFMERKRALNVLKELGLYAPAAVRDGLDQNADVSDSDTAMWIILDELAQEQAIAITSEDLRERVEGTYASRIGYLRQRGIETFSDPIEYFKNDVRQAALSVATVEADLKSWMRAELYSTLLKSTLAIADPGEIEKLWKENKENTLYAFDYVEVPAADFTEAARAELPDDEGLLQWLHSQSEQIQQGFRTDDRISVEVAWVPMDGGALGTESFDASALLEKYPVPATWDELAEARKYYDAYSNLRFRTPSEEEDAAKDEPADEVKDEVQDEAKDEPAQEATDEPADEAQDDSKAPDETETPPSEGDQATPPEVPPSQEPEPEPKLYLTFEESEAKARLEAGWKRALDAWLADLQKRSQAGETVDFRAEAEAFGLSYEQSGEALARETLERSPGWGGPLIVGSLFFGQPGRFTPRLMVQETSMVIGRQVAKVGGVERPIDEIRDRLKEAWVADRAGKLALEKVEALRGELGTRPAEGSEEVFLPTADRDTFAKVVEAAGFKVVQRPPLRQFSLPGDDFDAATPADQHIRSSRTYFDFEVGQVPPAEKNAAGTHAILVRLESKDTAPLDEMKPLDLQDLRQQAASAATLAFEQRYLRADSPQAHALYKIYLRSLDEANEKTQS